MKKWSHKLFKEAKFDDTYSIDLDFPIGTTVYATLKGVVDEVIDKFKGNYAGTDWDRGYKAYLRINYIIINTGYHHLKCKGSVVKIRQKIKAGQLICYSGNPDWSMRPHLHFSLFKKIKGMIRKTISFKFIDYNKSLEDKYYVVRRKRFSNKIYCNHQKFAIYLLMQKLCNSKN